MKDLKTNPNDVAKQLQEGEVLLCLAGKFLKYANGCYSIFSEHDVCAAIKKVVEDEFCINLRNEVKASLMAGAHIAPDRLRVPDSSINLKNGILNFETFEVLPHSPVYHFT